MSKKYLLAEETSCQKAIRHIKRLPTSKRLVHGYIAIISKFKPKYDDLTHPLILFHNRIMELSNAYSWEAVLVLALSFHKECIIIRINDAEVWRMSRTIIDEHLRNVKPMKSSLSLRSILENSLNTHCIN